MGLINISRDVIFGESPKPGYTPIEEYPLIIIVGLTGSGKTTLCNLLNSQEELFFIPERRIITDKVIIPSLKTKKKVKEDIYTREERFEFSNQFRKNYPGGMGFILSQLHIKLPGEKSILVFDGLRGENEVSFAINNLSKSLFILLDAPDNVRVKRLIKRKDSFDRVNNELKEIDLELLGKIFSLEELREIHDDINKGHLEAKQVIEKSVIVHTEKKNYSPELTKEVLLNLAKDRTYIFDTTKLEPKEIYSTLKEHILSKFKGQKDEYAKIR